MTSSQYETLQDEFQVVQRNSNQNSLLADPQKAMVVFDLTRNPAIVLTTNDIFCKMLGYEMVRNFTEISLIFLSERSIRRAMA